MEKKIKWVYVHDRVVQTYHKNVEESLQVTINTLAKKEYKEMFAE